jgi:hypothetical protein
MVSDNPGHDSFHDIVGLFMAQSKNNIEAAQNRVSASGIPLPPEVVEGLTFLPYADFWEVIKFHPGYKLYERRQSYWASLSIFRQSIMDLLGVIADFEYSENNWEKKQNDQELDGFTRRIQKEIFSTTNSAHSLVEHCTRRLNKKIQIPLFKDHLEKFFENDGLHEFVIALRGTLHHLHMIEAGWQFEFDYVKQIKISRYVLHKSDIMQAFSQSADKDSAANREKAAIFLQSTDSTVDIKKLFEEYKKRTENFHMWFAEILSGNIMDPAHDIDRCINERDKFLKNQFAAILNQINYPDK